MENSRSTRPTPSLEQAWRSTDPKKSLQSAVIVEMYEYADAYKDYLNG